MYYTCCATFLVTRDRIRARPLEHLFEFSKSNAGFGVSFVSSAMLTLTQFVYAAVSSCCCHFKFEPYIYILTGGVILPFD